MTVCNHTNIDTYRIGIRPTVDIVLCVYIVRLTLPFPYICRWRPLRPPLCTPLRMSETDRHSSVNEIDYIQMCTESTVPMWIRVDIDTHRVDIAWQHWKQCYLARLWCPYLPAFALLIGLTWIVAMRNCHTSVVDVKRCRIATWSRTAQTRFPTRLTNCMTVVCEWSTLLIAWRTRITWLAENRAKILVVMVLVNKRWIMLAVRTP
jgi:hypothetical protein